MPAVTFTADATRLEAHLARIGPDVEEALLRALKPLAGELAGEARSAAQAHIRFFGKKPGQYVASIYGDARVKDGQTGKVVTAFVRSGHPLAHLLEYGTQDRYKKTFRTAREVLGQLRAGYTGAMPAYPAIKPVLAAHRSEIEDVIRSAADEGAK